MTTETNYFHQEFREQSFGTVLFCCSKSINHFICQTPIIRTHDIVILSAVLCASENGLFICDIYLRIKCTRKYLDLRKIK
jgi:hypothetical protein